MRGSTFLLALKKTDAPISVDLREKRKTHFSPFSLFFSSHFYEHSPFMPKWTFHPFLFFFISFIFFYFISLFYFFFPHLLHHVHMAQCESCISSVPHGSYHVSLSWVAIWHHMIMPCVTRPHLYIEKCEILTILEFNEIQRYS